jgi:hypothetical protein
MAITKCATSDFTPTSQPQGWIGTVNCLSELPSPTEYIGEVFRVVGSTTCPNDAAGLYTSDGTSWISAITPRAFAVPAFQLALSLDTFSETSRVETVVNLPDVNGTPTGVYINRTTSILLTNDIGLVLSLNFTTPI